MNIFFQDMSLPNAAAAQRVEADPTNARFNSGANIWFWKPAVEQANKIFPMLEGRSNLGKEVRQQVEDIKLEISAAVAEAKEAGCKFALSTDSWKSKSETQAFHLHPLGLGFHILGALLNLCACLRNPCPSHCREVPGAHTSSSRRDGLGA